VSWNIYSYLHAILVIFQQKTINLFNSG
jgi:hypothetical protein